MRNGWGCSSIVSIIKYENRGCTRQAKNQQHTAENVLHRKFHFDAPNEMWLTDMTEFKYYADGGEGELYLSVILDLYDRRIVSFVIDGRNDNKLVFNTFDQATKAKHYAKPLFHSDRASLVSMIEDYIDYYNNRHIQGNLGVVTPLKIHRCPQILDIFLQLSLSMSPASNAVFCRNRF